MISDEEDLFSNVPLLSQRSKKPFKGRNMILKTKKLPKLKIKVTNARGKDKELMNE